MSKTIKIFTLLLLLLGSKSQASTFRRLVKQACWRLKSVRAEMALSKSERIKVAAGIPTFVLGLNALGDAYLAHQENKFKAGLAKMASKSGAASKKKRSLKEAKSIDRSSGKK